VAVPANIFAKGEKIRLLEFRRTRRMPKLKTVDLTRRESQIMEILYRRRRATVEEIRSELPDAPGSSSVRKLLEIMIERGLLAREYDGPRYVYFPAVKPEEARRSALKQLVRTFFDNSPGSAIAALLDITSTPLSAAEYRRLNSLLARAREQGDEQ
jgi:BlaI family transcriptional regulator, penicillinase repressor